MAHEYSALELPEQHSSQLEKVGNGFHCKSFTKYIMLSIITILLTLLTYPCHEVSFVCRLALISPRGLQSGLIGEYYTMMIQENVKDWDSVKNLVKFTKLSFYSYLVVVLNSIKELQFTYTVLDCSYFCL